MSCGDKLRESGFSKTSTILDGLSPGGGDDEFKAKIADAILQDHKELMEKGAKPAAPAPAPLPTVVNTTPAGAKMQAVSLLSPRGKFDLEFRDRSLQLENKASGAVECLLESIASVFELPLPNSNPKVKVVLFAMVLSAPITVGKSTINYIVLQGKDGDKAIANIDGAACSKLASTGAGGKLQGPPHDVISQIILALTDKTLIKHDPYTFLSHKQGAGIKCNIKSVHDGFMFPTSKGIWFVNKFVFIPRGEVAWVEFGRTSAMSTRTFDLVVMTKEGTKHEFSMIEKEEHTRVLEYIKKVKLMTKEEADKAKAAGGGGEKKADKDGGGAGSKAKAAKSEKEGEGMKEGADADGKGSSSGGGDDASVVEKEKAVKEEEDEDGDEDDDSDEGDSDFKCDVDSDEESDGYDAIEAMDVENMVDKNDEDDDNEDDEDEDEDDDDEEEEGEEENGDEGGGERDGESACKAAEGGGSGSGSSSKGPSLATKPAQKSGGYVPGAVAAGGGGGDTEDEDEGEGGEPPSKRAKASE